MISGIQRVSRPGRRVYAGADAMPTVLGGLGVSILTTSRGVMTGRAAAKAGVGGEVLCNGVVTAGLGFRDPGLGQGVGARRADQLAERPETRDPGPGTRVGN